MNNLSVRAAVLTDLSAVSSIVAEAGLFPVDMLAPMIAPLFASEGGQDRWRVVERDGTPVAFLYAEPERMSDGAWNMLAVAVSAAARRAGVARLLIGAFERELAEDGARVLVVETTTLPEFAPARALYPALGFQVAGEIRDFYADGEHKIIFAKRLRG